MKKIDNWLAKDGEKRLETNETGGITPTQKTRSTNNQCVSTKKLLLL